MNDSHRSITIAHDGTESLVHSFCSHCTLEKFAFLKRCLTSQCTYTLSRLWESNHFSSSMMHTQINGPSMNILVWSDRTSHTLHY